MRKAIDCDVQSLLAILVGIWKITKQETQTGKANLIRFQRGPRTCQGFGQRPFISHSEKELAMFCLYPGNLGLVSKVLDDFNWQRKCQDRKAFHLRCRFYSLPLFRSNLHLLHLFCQFGMEHFSCHHVLNVCGLCFDFIEAHS